MVHRPDIDGLRALAVIPVVLFHMELSAFSGGFVGVDVFFVISGFLITSIIVADLERGRFSLRRFYERRIRRIFPALFTVLAVTTLLAAVILLPRDLEDYSKTLVATSVFASNIHFWRQAGYFDAESHTKPLLHTWSLAVEEQFYILFPLLLIVLHRWWPRRLKGALAVLAVASFVASVVTVRADQSAAFYLAHTRAWELLLGSLLALGAFPAIRRAAVAEGAALVGLLLLGVSFTAYTEDTVFPGAAALAPCLGAALLIHSGTSVSTRASRFLSLRPLVFVGLISYSLYLWHWALLSMARHWTLDPLTMGQTTLVVAIAALAAAGSWRFVEQPLRAQRPGARVPAPRPEAGVPERVPGGGSASPVRSLLRLPVSFRWAGAVSATAVALGMFGVVTGGWPARMEPRVLALDAAQLDFNTQRPACHADDQTPIRYRDTCRYGAASAVPRYAVWGDSHAVELSLALGEAAAQAGDAVRMVSYSGCPPVLEIANDRLAKCAAHNRETLDAMLADASLETVFLVARYSQARADVGASVFTGIGEVAGALADGGKHVVLVYPSPEYAYSVPVQLARAAHRGQDLATIGLARATFDALRAPFVRALDAIREDPRIGKVDPARRLCDQVRCRVWADGHALYFDDDHLSVNGARYVLPLFDRFFGADGDAGAGDIIAAGR